MNFFFIVKSDQKKYNFTTLNSCFNLKSLMMTNQIHKKLKIINVFIRNTYKIGKIIKKKYTIFKLSQLKSCLNDEMNEIKFFLNKN